MQLSASSARLRGFTLIELMVTIALFSILMALAAPPMMQWIRGSKVRAVADSLQNGLRTAQAEALRRSRQTVFALTNGKPTTNAQSYTAAANGTNWAISTPKSAMSANSTFLEAGILTDVGSGVQIAGPAALCFNSIGRLVANTDTDVPSATCALPTSPATNFAYDVTLAGTDLKLRVTVGLGGQVRMCDPVRTLSATAPDGC